LQLTESVTVPVWSGMKAVAPLAVVWAIAVSHH
jgi:hypothetical protein